MSDLPVDPYDRTLIVEPDIDNPDRAPLAGTGRDIVVSLKPPDDPGRLMKFLNSAGHWVPFTTTDLSSWGGIIGDINDQVDLQAQFGTKANSADIARVGYSGQYADLLGTPTLGDLASVNFPGGTSNFLRADGSWAIPQDVYARWGNIAGSITDQNDLTAALALKAPIQSPIFTGNPAQAVAPPVDDNSNNLATTSWFFGQAFNATPQMDGVGSSGDSTLWARGNHRHPTDTTLAPLDSPQFTGMPTGPTPPTGNASQRLATTAFVAAAITAAGLTPPPSDGKLYGMLNGVWTVIDTSTKWDKA